MPLTFNISAFKGTAALVGCSPLVKAYCTCVQIEIALKEVAPPGNWGHDVAGMLERIQAHTPVSTGQLFGYAASYRTVMKMLWCRSKGGGADRVSPLNYPAIRYLRHSSDWSSDASADADIQRLNSNLQMLLFFLRNNTAAPL
jgi:hypothetical protein